MALLNDFFAEMIEVVDRNNGIINKFLGDGFLALFGAPLDDPAAATNALAAARGMLDAVDAWNRDRPRQALRIGIGIHIGEAVTGTVGSPQRKEYTVIGDTVNLAARLEQLTKETGSRLLVSSSVHDATPAATAPIDLGPMAIRGYDEGGAGMAAGLIWYFAYGSNMDAARLFEERLKPRGRRLRASASPAGSTAGGSPSTSSRARSPAGAGAGNIVMAAGRGRAWHAERPAARRASTCSTSMKAWRAVTTNGARCRWCAPTPARRSRRSPTWR